MQAFDTFDPDGDNYSFLRFTYPEDGTCKLPVEWGQPENSHGTCGIAPKVDKEETFHVILRVTDEGEPQLSSYKRIIVTVLPE